MHSPSAAAAAAAAAATATAAAAATARARAAATTARKKNKHRFGVILMSFGVLFCVILRPWALLGAPGELLGGVGGL